MSSETSEESLQQNNETRKEQKSAEAANATDKKTLTFKDWKSLKESQNNTSEKSETTKTNAKSRFFRKNSNKDSKNNNKGFSRASGPNFQTAPNFFGVNNSTSNFIPNNFVNNYTSSPPLNWPNNFNRFSVQNNYNNSYSSGPGNNFNQNNNFNVPNNFGFNNCNGRNNFNRQNYGRNNFNGSNNSNTLTGFNRPNSVPIGGNKFNGPNNRDLPDSFFASDGFYRQRDMMQKPLPDHNPFRDEHKSAQLLNQFDQDRYTKEDNNKKNKGNKKKPNTQKPLIANDITSAENMEKSCTEPKIYVPNPKGFTDGKPYIPLPSLPEQNPDITREEKKQQWREYREAMKPFKNREFYNAKRVVQRLGKKDPSQLEEKEIFRLENAREIMAAHKARLSAKYPNYEKSEDATNALGELYVLKKKPLKDWDIKQPLPKVFQNYGNFGENQTNNDFETGRKILGGFSGFVPGGMLDRN